MFSIVEKILLFSITGIFIIISLIVFVENDKKQNMNKESEIG